MLQDTPGMVRASAQFRPHVTDTLSQIRRYYGQMYEATVRAYNAEAYGQAAAGTTIGSCVACGQRGDAHLHQCPVCQMVLHEQCFNFDWWDFDFAKIMDGVDTHHGVTGGAA